MPWEMPTEGCAQQQPLRPVSDPLQVDHRGPSSAAQPIGMIVPAHPTHKKKVLSNSTYLPFYAKLCHLKIQNIFLDLVRHQPDK